MKISVNTIRGLNKRYGCSDDIAPKGIDNLVEKIGAQLGAVEEVTDVGKKYQGAVIVKIVKCAEHTGSDHLNICTIDDGGSTPAVTRDENGFVQVVCGAPNVRQGLAVVWLPPGAIVPESYDKAQFVLEAREIRGVVSNGMLASARELAIGDDHAGIIEIQDEVEPGTLFATQYGLDGDYSVEIENKMFTHRPDCFGFLGVSRELAGIQNMPFRSPDWYIPNPRFPAIEADPLPLEVVNEIPELVRRFTAITMRDVAVGPSPVWLQVELAKAGMKSINNIVDYSNFFMLETAQPIHIYDYDKVMALSDSDRAVIVVRCPKPGEKISLLNGKTIEPDAKTMMVATNQKLICLGGAMGGLETEVDETTKNIIIEAANWDMYTLRRSSMAYGIFTDAVTRFTKGQSPLQNLAVVAKIVDEIRKFASGKVASQVIDVNHLSADVMQRLSPYPPVSISGEFINERLGLSLTKQEIVRLLTNVEFRVEDTGDTLTITAPFWRTDIEIPEDIVEEVGRLYGYDHLPLELPRRDLAPASKNELLELKRHVRETLSKAGANEVLTYSFVHGNLLEKSGQDKNNAFQLSNALSPDLQYYRMSLTPSLLDKVHSNIKTGHESFALFEIGTLHLKGIADKLEPDVPQQDNHVAFVVTAADKLKPAGNAYYLAKNYLKQLAPELAANLIPLSGFDFKEDEWGKQLAAPYLPERSGIIVRDGIIWGIVGEFKASVGKALKLPAYTAGFEIGLEALLSPNVQGYVPLPRFPKVQQDITLKVPAAISFQAINDLLVIQLLNQPNMYATLQPLDIYERSDDDKHKQLTFRFAIASYEKTLKSEEVNAMLDRVAQAVQDTYGAVRL